MSSRDQSRNQGPRARPILPQLDILRGALDRQDPNPASVGEFTRLAQQRRVFMVGWVRQALLTRARDDRQFNRVLLALAPFPDVPIVTQDHIHAAWLIRDLTERNLRIQPAQALLWVMAERTGAHIWTDDHGWWALAEHGAPLHRSGG